MEASIHIDNANNYLLKLIKAVISADPSIRFTIAREKNNDGFYEVIHRSPAYIKALNQEVKQLEEDYKAGKVKAYSSADEFRQAVENGEV